ncbi:putative quinol monooxygenase [Heyndrickxia acidicola]|uniref:Quinol monooxygenase n=1 Tax=Heyndrickxia acidicola TaxID=209389 RepID=A0ABU6MFW3_9BACI|nr:putative quinol monooxygenase [Heyndrickxia acidicola]MED1203561.1 putative quinol monooxygenase [Heyndrickxia acidicola]
MGNIVITAILRAKTGNEDQLLEVLQQVVPPSQNEIGCIKYQLHQSLDEEGVYTFYEVWQDEDSMKKHIESDHYKVYRQHSEHLVEHRDVYRLKML